MTIIFDAGGVLFYIEAFRNDIFRRVLKSSGYGHEDIEAGLSGLKKFDRDYLKSNGVITWEDEKAWLTARANYLANAIDPKCCYLPDKLYMLAFDTFQYHLYDETLSILDGFKKNHQLYVLSNAAASLDWAFDYLDIRKYFLEVVISSYVGYDKPDHRIYDHTLNLIDDDLGNCVFIDDRIENVEAAIACGIDGFHLDRNSGMTLNNFVTYLEAL